MPSRITCRLTGVSLTLDVGYVFRAAPAKRSRCSLRWRRGIFSRPLPLRPWTRGSSSPPSCAPQQPSLEVGLLLSGGAPELRGGEAPLGRRSCAVARSLQCVRNRFNHVLLLATLWTIARQTPVCGLLQARILVWVATPSSRASSPPRDRTFVSYISPTLAGGFFPTVATLLQINW